MAGGKKKGGGKGGSGPSEEISDDEFHSQDSETEILASPRVIHNTYNTVNFQCEKFNPSTMLWDRWLQRIEGAFATYAIPAEKHVQYLVHNVELDTFNLLADKVAPKNPYTMLYKDVVDILTAHFSPKPLEIAEIFKFNRRSQRENESVRDFVAALEKLAIHCGFKDYLKNALRNQLVCGIRDEGCQKRLLEQRDLTFDKAIEIAYGHESTSHGTATLNASTDDKVHQNHAESNALHTGKNSRRPNKGPANVRRKFDDRRKPDDQSDKKKKFEKSGNNSDKKCFRCSKIGHTPDNCFHRKAECRFCKKVGHIEPACSKKKKEKPAHATVLDAMEEFANVYVNETSGRVKIWVHPKVNSTSLKMQLDCAADVSTVNYKLAAKLWPDAEVLESKLTIFSFNGMPSKSFGKILVHVTFEGNSKDLYLYLVKEERSPLFGMEWILMFKTDWNKYIPYAGEISTLSVTSSNENSPPPDVLKLLRYYDLSSPGGVGKISGIEVQIQLKEGAKPVFMKARPVPFSLVPGIDATIDKHVTDGVLVPVEASDWATPIVPVLKASGEVRICGDYKVTVNPQIVIDAYPMPTFEELFKDMEGEEYSKIDLCQAFLHLPLSMEAQLILTLNTHRGLFRPTRMMFGFASAPAIWQRTIETVMAGIRGIKISQDDIYSTGRTREEHLQRLREVLERLKKHNLKINLTKSVFFMKSIEYCGYRIDKQGIHPIKAKCDAISNMTQPQNKKDVEIFRGLVNYYSRFVPEFSKIMHPLSRLSRDDVEFEWCQECERAFQKIKRLLSSDQVLVHFNPSLPLIIATDASPFAVAAILSHKYPDGSERPIQYASQSLNSTQQKYAHIDKEAYGIVFGIKKFHQFVYGRRFELITDSQPLTKIFSPDKGLPIHSAVRMQHYAIFLQSYDFSIRYRQTKAHCNVDALSRLPSTTAEATSNQEPDLVQINILEELPVTSEMIAKQTDLDPKLKKLKIALQMGHSLKPADRFNINMLEFSLQSGCIVRGQRVVIPASLRSQMMNKLHASHFGVTKMKLLARSICWWPGISSDVENLASNCTQCSSFANNPAKVHLSAWKPPKHPFERIHIDFAGPFLELKYFVLVDAYSKWPEITVVNNEDAKTVIQECNKIFSRFGLPEEIVSDNGPAFTSDDFQQYVKENGIRHSPSAPFHPATNGQVERYNATFKKALNTLAAKKNDVHEKLEQFLTLYRRTPHVSSKKSPAELMLGRNIRTKIDLVVPNTNSPSSENTRPEMQGHRSLNVGDRVAARDYSSKNKRKWQFGKIIQKFGNLHYDVLLDDNRQWKRHIDQLRRIGTEVGTKAPATDRSRVPVQVTPDSSDNARPKRNIRKPVKLDL